MFFFFSAGPEMMTRYASDLTSGVNVIMHEMMHALGFSSDSFPLFRYQDALRTPRCVEKKYGTGVTLEDRNRRVRLKLHGLSLSVRFYTSACSTPRNPFFPWVPADPYRFTYTCAGSSYYDYLPAGNTVSYFAERGMVDCSAGPFPAANCVARLVTPAVKAASQAFFNCTDLPGAEIENDQGDDCSLLGSHWEYRVFAGEMMSPYDVAQRQGFSAVTLALFEDSGWGECFVHTLTKPSAQCTHNRCGGWICSVA